MRDILVYIESNQGKLKKNAFEVLTYGSKAAASLGVGCKALLLGKVDDASELVHYGVSEIHQCSNAAFDNFDSQTYSAAIVEAAESLGCGIVIAMHTANGKQIAGRLAMKMDAGAVSAVNSLPTIHEGKLLVSRPVYSGKASAAMLVDSENIVLTVNANSMPLEKSDSAGSISELSLSPVNGRVKVLERKTVSGQVPLPEAELVVSAGRGMKGPENWGIIEEMAEVLGATTACSRPVADTGWRPHHEHVGQTGIAIRPNLYIAVGISGAIQHLAGVNNSKVIVVINKDPEAPFFKAADYGVVADLFDVVPRLNEALKKFKAN